MEKDNGKAYSEVIEILKLLDDEKRLEALPMEMLEVLKSKADPEYKPQIFSEIPLDEQNLQPETLPILSWISMKYWNSEEKRDELFELKSDTQKEEQNEEKIKQEEKNEQAQEKLQQQEEIKQEEENEQAQEKLQQEETEFEYKEDTNSIEDKERKIEEINETLPIAHNQMKWYEKLKMKIMEFINKLFNKNK